ncbi:MAG: glycoside hydrolase family 127 protein [Lachnospiraceae bacterium]|nr:glycoside hydrolase family 127 protein [Lachnospiraceae bacterium]
MNYASLSKPFLYPSQLKYRLGLAKKRLTHYPVDSMNFIMMDLERPRLRSRHAHWCTYDLTGRMLQFYSLAEGVDGEHIEVLNELFERIMNNRHKSGVFGNAFEYTGESPEKATYIGTHFMSGLVNYYELTGDMRALNAAQACAEFLFAKGDAFYAEMANPFGPHKMSCWIAEGFAELYKQTQKEVYLDAVRRIASECMGQLQGAHSHGYMTTLRGILKAAIYAEDAELAEFVRVRRQEIIDRGCMYPNGDISEMFPESPRNEGCSIADWIMLNLLYGFYFDDSSAYELAEYSLWNALYFNQFVTGGFGHRYFGEHGYKTYIEEAWWCCTENCGMCLTETARHAVTMKNGLLKLNFLIPGQYTIKTPSGEIRVCVTTKYPTNAETIIRVEGTQDDMELRIPSCIRAASCRRVNNPLGYTLYLDGKMGHYTEIRNDRMVVKYGPLVIAPMMYHWDLMTAVEQENTVPEGYCHEALKGRDFKLALTDPDENGFYRLKHDPLPEWSIFEEGEMAGISGGEAASAYIPVVFPDGTKKELFFQPLCSATSNLTLMDIVSDFTI